MNSNAVLFMGLSLVAGVQLYKYNKQLMAGLLLILTIVGIIVTKNSGLSIGMAIIVTYILGSYFGGGDTVEGFDIGAIMDKVKEEAGNQLVAGSAASQLSKKMYEEDEELSQKVTDKDSKYYGKREWAKYLEVTEADEVKEKLKQGDLPEEVTVDALYDAIKALSDADGEEEKKEEYTNALKSKNVNKALERGETFSINPKDTLTNLYKSLDKKEVSGITKDTQNLIETQKKLIETLNVMGPSLKQSKDILDTFKNYFGDDLKF
jgi:hypothetical protein